MDCGECDQSSIDVNQWLQKDNSMISPQGVSLEEEIRLLRKWMERLVDEEQSFTTEVVIAISTLLDLKINEFMKKQER
ncbi:aspartyl-phosphate phosphatase Spo0E family protein [Paenibacillus turicensis]|uniref:Uncharacterized protein n=2 Tax=Paenibacillus turicensis TaxID=160487 RepID=A0ABS4FRN0_9BACL|nr:hypothetical protein [Paenibacillus turicensis]